MLCRFFLFMCVAVLAAFAPQARAQGESAAPPALWFDVGEELVYSIHWGVIRVGETRVTTEWIEEGGRRLLYVRYRTRSNSFLKHIYPVDDTIEAVIEPVSFLPVRFVKQLSEGSRVTDQVTVFDHAAGVAHWTDNIKNKQKDFEIEPDTRDLVTFMYYMRRNEFTPGEKIEYRVMADEKIYDVFLNVGPVDTMKMEGYGKVKSVRITPEAAFEGLFVRKGKMVVWVSRDARRVATRIQATVPVADVHINLREVRGPGHDSWVGGKGAPASAAAAPRELEEKANAN